VGKSLHDATLDVGKRKEVLMTTHLLSDSSLWLLHGLGAEYAGHGVGRELSASAALSLQVM
jgi:hypothetical protein